ncbi:MAG: hypothetical protein GWO08_15190, partial [Gammaproteobacteria bacterium]|nr:hypothetical protein [Gammaproteobacteria bacterium]NIR94954.1 hypothetical protein [Gammaproteobacteria bacterium]
MRATRLFQEGKNCWKIAHCNQAAFIIDGKDYFKALYQAIPDTQSHFIILSWDIMSQFQLVREQQDIGTLPTALGELLNVVVSENENVEG